MAMTLGLRRLAVIASFGAAGTLAAQPPAPAGPPNVVVLPPSGTSTPPPAPVTVPPPPNVVDLTPPELAHKSTFESNPEGCKDGECAKPAFLTSVEYLLIRPRRRGNDYAIVDPTDNLTPEGKIKSVGYETDSGLRASVGYRSPCALSAAFKRVRGVSPQQHRAAALAG